MPTKKEPKEEEPQKVEETTSVESTLKSEEGEKAPEGMGDAQAKAFIEMRHEIKDLKDQLDKRQDYQPQVPPTPQYQEPTYQAPPTSVDRTKYFNQETGDFDFEGYDSEVQKRISNAQATQSWYAQATAKEEAEWAMARVQNPQLDTDNDFAEDVWGQFLVERVKNPQVSPLTVVAKVKQKWEKLAKKEQAQVEKVEEQVKIEKEIATGDTGAHSAGQARAQEVIDKSEEEDRLSWISRGVYPEVVGHDTQGNPIRKKVPESEVTEALVARIKSRPWVKSKALDVEST